jgi:hypothetical protein
VTKKSFQELVRAHTEEAVEFLVNALHDEGTPASERYKAAELLLAHGHGKPVDRQVVATMEGSAGGRPSLSALIEQVQPLLESTPPSGLKAEGDARVSPPDKFSNISNLVSDDSLSGECIYVEKADGDEEEGSDEEEG